MSTDRLQATFKDRLESQGLRLTEDQCELFDTYYRLLVVWNEKMNLTRITERTAVYWKHFYDSLSLAFFVDLTEDVRLLDVGSGAGFPAVPLKIAFPHLRVTAVDLQKKRLTFLSELKRALRLRDFQFVHARAEELGRDGVHREQYDIATARAVARLNVLCEYCLPFVRLGGQFLAMKTDRYSEEVRDAAAAMDQLGGRYAEAHTFALPHQFGRRSIVRIVKEKRTPEQFPRRAGIPAKQPIQ